MACLAGGSPSGHRLDRARRCLHGAPWDRGLRGTSRNQSSSFTITSGPWLASVPGGAAPSPGKTPTLAGQGRGALGTAARRTPAFPALPELKSRGGDSL